MLKDAGSVLAKHRNWVAEQNLIKYQKDEDSYWIDGSGQRVLDQDKTKLEKLNIGRILGNLQLCLLKIPKNQ